MTCFADGLCYNTDRRTEVRTTGEKTVIYLDVLLLSNLWADYALLRTAACITHVKMPRLRGLLAALLGAASALTVLLPPFSVPVSLCFRLLLTLLICGTAFGFRNLRLLLRQTGVLLALSMLFCGAMYLLSVLFAPQSVTVRNLGMYADISLMTLLGGTAAAAGVTVFLSRRRACQRHRCYRLLLRIQAHDFVLPALADTGNTLTDLFTGKPVAVVSAAALTGWLSGYPDTVTAAMTCAGFRMLPVRTVTGEAVLPAIRPEKACLCKETGAADGVPLDILVALSDDLPAESPAILNLN